MRQRWVIPILLLLLLLHLAACQGGQATRKTSPNLAHSAEKGSITIAWDSNSEPNLGGV